MSTSRVLNTAQRRALSIAAVSADIVVVCKENARLPAVAPPPDRGMRCERAVIMQLLLPFGQVDVD